MIDKAYKKICKNIGIGQGGGILVNLIKLQPLKKTSKDIKQLAYFPGNQPKPSKEKNLKLKSKVLNSI